MNTPLPPALNFDTFKQRVGFWWLIRQSLKQYYATTARIIVTLIILALIFLIGHVMIILAVSTDEVGLVAFILFVLVGLPLLTMVAMILQYVHKARQRVYMQRFAASNHFDFLATKIADGMPGAIFNLGHSRKFETVVLGTYQNLPFEFGNYTYTVGSGKNSHTHNYGVLRISLSRRLPHILLDGTYNNFWRISNLPSFRNSQRLQLEGDFNKYFELYVPDGYERDALYIITPELMQQLIEYGAKFDIELVDDNLFLYSGKPFALNTEASTRGIFDLINLIGSEVEQNVARYSDANIGDRKANLVAASGRRLKKSFSWIAAILLTAYILYSLFYWIKNIIVNG